MTPWLRRTAVAGGVVGMAAALFVVGAALGSPPEKAPPGPGSSAAAQTGDRLSKAIASLQADLATSPANYRGWSDLGLAYVQQARLTADPSYYPKAEGAFAKSLALSPKDNADALVGQATLASARHDFPRALVLVDSALKINGYSAIAYGVKADDLTELGRYDDAVNAVQKMLDLRPGTDSFTRASYQRELRGDVPGARDLLQRAAQDASAPADKAFSYYYLGELAWNNGDRKGARDYYDQALAVDPAYLPALTGQAKSLAAAGDTTAALSLYREAVDMQPQPAYVVELSELLQASGQTKAAAEQFDVVRATEKLFVAAGANVDLELALFEADHGSPATSLRYATSAYKTRPDSILVQDAYAWALHRAGRSKEALPIARAALRLGTRLPGLQYHLGAIAAAAGERSAARTALTTALRLNPHFDPLQAPAARRLLGSLG